ncbi:hypothetical protein [Sphingobium chlorophenolicum]|uniref:Lipoprotein n=1 Tax=Sphingobium chlorophenolicum TaxID=46429 RepID=A0A081RCF1_SPHCR|nr:hypothetical protein [Sphingobium chlorophenolicum]KEQ52874.1 hypothetical protein BV95_02865 [Sphingobium chlorophenolicum]
MMARRGLLGVLAGGVVTLLSGCGLFERDPIYRFKMTIQVETPQGLKVASSIYEVRALLTNDLVTGGKGSRAVLRGEAVALDMPNGKALFALLRLANAVGSSDDLADMSMRVLDPAFDGNCLESAKRIASSDGVRSPSEVPLSDYPLLITFADTADPKSVQQVDPVDLVAALDVEAKIKHVTVERTDQDVSSGIGKRLGWLGVYPEPRLDNAFKPTPNPTLAQKLRHGDFYRGNAR